MMRKLAPSSVPTVVPAVARILVPVLVVLSALSLAGTARAESAPGERGKKNNKGEKIDLRLNLKKGQVYRVRAIVRQEMEQTLGGAKVQTKASSGFTYAMEVRDVAADGVRDVKVTYDDAVYTAEGAAGRVEYDSRHPPDTVPPAARSVAALVGQSFTMKMGPDGRVIEVAGLAELRDAMVKKLQLLDDPRGQMSERLVKTMVSDDAVRQSVEMMTAIYPDRPVAVGDSWKRELKVSVGVPLVMHNTYTLKGLKGDRAEVAVESNAETDPKAPPLDLGPMRISYDLKGTETGTLELDRASGWIEAGEQVQKLSGSAKLEGDRGEPVSVPMTAENRMTLEPAKPVAAPAGRK